MNIKDVAKKLKIKESVKFVYDYKYDMIICTELRVIRASADGKKKWEHDMHYDVIIAAKISGDKIRVEEFNGAYYFLDLETGKDLK
jgi:hypothetical protein